MNYSREYWRGVSTAYETLYEGKEDVDSLPEWFHNDDSDFANGARAQAKAWPVAILVPAELQPRPTNFGCAVLSGLALILFLAAVIGYPQIPGPWLGGMAVAIVILLIGAYRNMR
jgi:hypothetical protein